MTCADILTMATNLLAENTGSTVTLSEFNERAPYILAAFCGEARLIDKHYREAFMLGNQPVFDRVRLAPEAAFPLCDRLAYPAAFYLASTLIADENPEFSKIFNARCHAALDAIYGEIPCTLHPISNSYP